MNAKIYRDMLKRVMH